MSHLKLDMIVVFTLQEGTWCEIVVGGDGFSTGSASSVLN